MAMGNVSQQALGTSLEITDAEGSRGERLTSTKKNMKERKLQHRRELTNEGSRGVRTTEHKGRPTDPLYAGQDALGTSLGLAYGEGS